MNLKLHTEIIIQASISNVWEILSDFAKYKDWNPFILSAKGNLTVGEKLTVKIKPPGLDAQTFKPIVLKVRPQQEIRWAGVALLSWLFRGEHYLELKMLDPQTTKLIHGEIFSGVLVGCLVNRLKGAVHAGFLEMNKALAKRVEGRGQA